MSSAKKGSPERFATDDYEADESVGIGKGKCNVPSESVQAASGGEQEGARLSREWFPRARGCVVGAEEE